MGVGVLAPYLSPVRPSYGADTIIPAESKLRAQVQLWCARHRSPRSASDDIILRPRGQFRGTAYPFCIMPHGCLLELTFHRRPHYLGRVVVQCLSYLIPTRSSKRLNPSAIHCKRSQSGTHPVRRSHAANQQSILQCQESQSLDNHGRPDRSALLLLLLLLLPTIRLAYIPLDPRLHTSYIDQPWDGNYWRQRPRLLARSTTTITTTNTTSITSIRSPNPNEDDSRTLIASPLIRRTTLMTPIATLATWPPPIHGR